MSYIVRVRYHRHTYWWSTSSYRPLQWHGPWRTAEEAERKADESIRNHQPTITGPGYPEPQGDHDPRPDLRQMAWMLWPEMMGTP
ncbi:MAG TPA: hypothetical protein VG815_07980 [Chloroflexota bacterium]|nr:hypothetical protein [Chloroflexota bacterium]